MATPSDTKPQLCIGSERAMGSLDHCMDSLTIKIEVYACHLFDMFFNNIIIIIYIYYNAHGFIINWIQISSYA